MSCSLPERLPKAPRHVQLELTNACQLRCSTCGRWKDSGSPNFADFAKIRDCLKELAHRQVESIVLTGGEPTLHPKVNDILRLAKELGMKVTLYTNGQVTSSVIINAIVESVDTLLVSMDGPTPNVHDGIRGISGAFDRARRLIARINAERDVTPQIGINHTISDANVNFVEQTVEEMQRASVDYVRLSIACGEQPHYISKENALHLRDVLARCKLRFPSDFLYFSSPCEMFHQGRVDADAIASGYAFSEFHVKNSVTCFLVFGYMLIDSFGDVFPCTSIHYSNDCERSVGERRSRFRLGNAFSESVSDIWNGVEFASFRRLLADAKFPVACGTCPFVVDFLEIERTLSDVAMDLAGRIYRFDN